MADLLGAMPGRDALRHLAPRYNVHQRRSHFQRMHHARPIGPAQELAALYHAISKGEARRRLDSMRAVVASSRAIVATISSLLLAAFKGASTLGDLTDDCSSTLQL